MLNLFETLKGLNVNHHKNKMLKITCFLIFILQHNMASFSLLFPFLLFKGVKKNVTYFQPNELNSYNNNYQIFNLLKTSYHVHRSFPSPK